METWITSLCLTKKSIGQKAWPVESKTLEEGVMKKPLPKQYHYLVAVFSKHTFITMPSSRHCDYKDLA